MFFYYRSHDKYCLLTLICLVFKEQLFQNRVARSDFINITRCCFSVNTIRTFILKTNNLFKIISLVVNGDFNIPCA